MLYTAFIRTLLLLSYIAMTLLSYTKRGSLWHCFLLIQLLIVINAIVASTESDTQVDNSSINIIVIGSGAAGLSCAIEASNLGANVLILEKQPNAGGNSAKASSGINGAETTIQESKNIHDTLQLFYNDVVRAGGGLGSEELVHKLVNESADAVHFLINDIKVPISDVIQLGGHSTPRTHRLGTHAPIGFSMIKGLQNKLLSNTEKSGENNADAQHVPSNLPGKVVLQTSSVVVRLLWETTTSETDADVAANAKGDGGSALNKRVVGVLYRKLHQNATSKKGAADENTGAAEELDEELITATADAVIIATGGMAYGSDLLGEFCPQFQGLATSSGPQADGSGMKIAREVQW